MRYLLHITLVFLQIGYLYSLPKPETGVAGAPVHSHGSHKGPNGRSVRCTPCEQSLNEGPRERGFPSPNNLASDPQYRGNGADNLGYDWTAMAWGGPAFPRKAKGPGPTGDEYDMRGRGGRQMMMGMNWSSGREGPGNVLCDTCRTYWNRFPGTGSGQESADGRQFPPTGHRDFSGPGQGYQTGPAGYWRSGDNGGPRDYETRVSSGTVGVLIKPGSRIAYIPSRSGDMFWDGVSGGGTRWDGFSNGISWVFNGPDSGKGYPAGREEKHGSGTYSQGPDSRPGSEYGGHRPYRPWEGQKGVSGWDSNGRGYYFADGYPSQMSPHWRDRGYASNWQYGSTNQNGWNGNTMKWTYESKHWSDNDRSANRFYFNSPEDRSYGPGGGNYLQYGTRYPNYQPWTGQQSSGGYRPSWRPDQGTRLNDRDPANFPSHGTRDRPWDYNSVNRFDSNRRPTFRPEWRPGQGYGDFSKDTPGKYPSANDKNDFGRPSYAAGKPEGGSGYPFGGHRFPGGHGDGETAHVSSGTLFYPNDDHKPAYPSDSRPEYQGTSVKPDHPSSGNQVAGGYPSNGGSYPSGDRNPSIIYVGGSGGGTGGGRPSGGSSGGNGYPGGTTPSYPSSDRPSSGSSGGSYSGSSGGSYSGSSGSNYPGSSGGSYSGSSGGTYPGSSGGSYSGSSSSGFSGSSGGSYSGSPGGTYPGGSSGGGYSGGVSRPVGPGYPGGASRPDDGHSHHDVRPGGYPTGGGSRPDGYPSGGGGGYPYGGYQSGGSGGGGGGGYSFGSSRPSYPVYDRPGQYPGEGSGYSGGYRDRYPSRYPDRNGYSGSGGRPTFYPAGQSSYPGYGYGSYGGNNRPKGYYTGIITELGPDNTPYGTSQGNYFGGSYPGDKNSYPGVYKDRYPYGGEGSNKYPGDGKDRFGDRDRYSGGGGGGGGGGGDYYSGGKDKGDRFFYYGNMDKDRYPDGGYYNGNGNGNGNGDRGDQSQGSTQDKNSWNYGDRQKDGIYHRSGGSYPPYRGGQYYTSSYLATLSTTTQQGAETKAQVTKVDEPVTQPTPES